MRRKDRPCRIIFLCDVENLVLSMDEKPSPQDFSLIGGFNREIRAIAREIGEIVDVFMFLPPHYVYAYVEHFHDAGFFTIVCPKVKGKNGEEADTVDSTLMRFGESAINNIQGLTHLCLVSGDRDFTPLIRKAIRKGLKIIIIAGSKRSLSLGLLKLADKAIIFSPTE